LKDCGDVSVAADSEDEQRALEQSPHNVEAKEMLGVVQLETGDLNSAKEVSFYSLASGRLSIHLAQTFQSLLPPNLHAPTPPPPAAHLYLAQLCDNDPLIALQHYRAAVDILMAQLKGKERAVEPSVAKDDELETRRTIVRAFIGQVEIWMDPAYDLWYVAQTHL